MDTTVAYPIQYNETPNNKNQCTIRDIDCVLTLAKGNLDIIREKQRDEIIRNRLQSKCVKLILNRKSLSSPYTLSNAVTNFDDDEDDDHLEDSLSTHSSDQDDSQIISWFFPESSSSQSISSRRDRNAQNLHKQAVFNDETIEKQMDEFCNLLLQVSHCCEAQNHLIRTNWSFVTVGLESKDEFLALKVVDSLNSIDNYDTSTFLCMLQNGLIQTLTRTIERNANESNTDILTRSVRFLTKICVNVPQGIPLLVDYMSTLSVFSKFEEQLTISDLAFARTLSKFYYVLSHTLMNQIISNRHQKPLLPDILSKTGISEETYNSYKPQQTLEKFLTANLVRGLVSQCVSKFNRRDQESINASLFTLANALKACHSSQNLDFIVGLARGFRDSSLLYNLKKLKSALKRSIAQAESSEHCSQGNPESTVAAQNTLEVCENFNNAYAGWYDPLSKLLEATEETE